MAYRLHSIVIRGSLLRGDEISNGQSRYQLKMSGDINSDPFLIRRHTDPIYYHLIGCVALEPLLSLTDALIKSSSKICHRACIGITTCVHSPSLSVWVSQFKCQVSGLQLSTISVVCAWNCCEHVICIGALDRIDFVVKSSILKITVVPR